MTLCQPFAVPLQPPWPGAAAVVARLLAAGHTAVVVGGCLRDHLQGLPVKDIDVATSARPEEVEAVFPRTIPVGKAFGVILVVVGPEEVVEVATFRREGSYQDGRRPSTVDFTDEIEDVRRRDFTINALVGDLQAGQIRDHVGGLADLASRCLRVVGDPRERLTEDRLRVLRAFRFAAHLDLTIEAATAQALRQTDLAGLSRERILEEWDKGLVGPHPDRWWDLLTDHGQARHLHPGLDRQPIAMRLARLAGHVVGEWSSEVRLAACLLDQEPAKLPPWLASQPWSRLRQRRLAWLVAQARPPTQWLARPRPDLRRMLQSEGAAGLIALCRASWPADPAGPALTQAEDHEHRQGPFQPLVRAEDLLRAGWSPGPALGQCLRWLEDQQLSGTFTTTAEGLQKAEDRRPVAGA